MKLISLQIIFLGMFAISGINVSFAEDTVNKHQSNLAKQQKPANVDKINTTYSDECSACHFLYPAVFLPERSWRQIMSNLHDHFGDNAELSVDKQQKILKYLVENSADNTSSKRSKRVMQHIAIEETPLRITETIYFKRRHHEIPDRVVKGNDQVKSFSNCNACHQTASQGSFSERYIKIPGYGRWED